MNNVLEILNYDKHALLKMKRSSKQLGYQSQLNALYAGEMSNQNGTLF